MPVDQRILYALATGATAAAVISQYFIPSSWIPGGWLGFVLGLLLVYGIGLALFFAFFRLKPLRNYVRRPRLGAKETARWYGIFGLLGLFLALALAVVYFAFEPTRTKDLLEKSTPVIQAGSANPLFYILFSIFFVGFTEETLFRGYLLGSILSIEGTRRWQLHALWTSLLFGGIHIYYAQTYLEISPIFYVRLVTLGLVFSYAYVYSGGNILFIALLHGAFDATAFLQLVPSMTNLAAGLSYLLLFGCGAYALVRYLQQNGFPQPTWDGSPLVGPGEWPPLPRPQIASSSLLPPPPA